VIITELIQGVLSMDWEFIIYLIIAVIFFLGLGVFLNHKDQKKEIITKKILILITMTCMMKLNGARSITYGMMN